MQQHIFLLHRAKAEKAAAAEAAHIGTDMETNMEEAERFVLPSGLEVEAAGRGPPDLALINRRIKETVRLLESFKVSRASSLVTAQPLITQYHCWRQDACCIPATLLSIPALA